MKFVISLLILTIGLMTNGCHGLSCQATTLGITHDKECPGLFDDSDEVFCCGPLNDRECCSFELDVENQITKHRVKHSVNGMSTEAPIDEKKLVTQEGLRDNVKKVKDKVNGTISHAKDKMKQKVKDKVKKKIEEKLNPTGGYLNFSTIIVVVAVSSIVIVILVCLCCCCLCPCCLLHQRRTRGVVHNPAQMQPIIVTTPNYVPLESGPYPPPQGHTTTPQPGYATAAPPPAGGNPPLYSEKQMAYNPNY